MANESFRKDCDERCVGIAIAVFVLIALLGAWLCIFEPDKGTANEIMDRIVGLFVFALFSVLTITLARTPKHETEPRSEDKT